MTGNLLYNRSGAAALEFALVFPVLVSMILGVCQFGYLLWIDNLLHYSVQAAARCSAVGSTVYPCYGSGTANMQSTANALFGMAVSPIPSGTFSANSSCTGSGLQASYTITFLETVPVTISAKSCYPNYT